MTGYFFPVRSTARHFQKPWQAGHAIADRSSPSSSEELTMSGRCRLPAQGRAWAVVLLSSPAWHHIRGCRARFSSSSRFSVGFCCLKGVRIPDDLRGNIEMIISITTSFATNCLSKVVRSPEPRSIVFDFLASLALHLCVSYLAGAMAYGS